METEIKAHRLVGGKTITNPKLLKDLYKLYYREMWKTLRIILTIAGAALIAVGLAAYSRRLPLMYAFIPAWIGTVMIVYPRNAYKKPYKAARNEQSTVFFAFYEDEMSEKTDGSLQKFRYDELHEIIETSQYFYFFHTKRSVSVLEKSGINRGSSEGLAAMLKFKVKKYKILK